MKKRLTLFLDFLKINRVRILVILILISIFVVSDIILQMKYNIKINKNEDYIYTKDFLEIENNVSRLPYININSKEAEKQNLRISDYFYNVTSSKDTLFDYEVIKERNNLILNIIINKLNNKKEEKRIICDINIRRKKVKCEF